MKTTIPDEGDTLSWRAGEVRRIPRLWGRDKACRITAVDARHVHFEGPWGPATISHDLYRDIMRRRAVQETVLSTLDERIPGWRQASADPDAHAAAS